MRSCEAVWSERVGTGARPGFESCSFYTQPLFPEGLFCAAAVPGTGDPATKKTKVLDCLLALSVLCGRARKMKSITSVL